MEIYPHKKSCHRHVMIMDTPTECLVLADGFSAAEDDVTIGSLNKISSMVQLITKLSMLSGKSNFPQRNLVSTKKLLLLEEGLKERFAVLDEPRNIFDPVYSEVGDDVATVVARYVESENLGHSVIYGTE